MCRSIFLAAVAGLLLAGPPAQGASLDPASQFSSFWVFGDSLSDTGNLFRDTGGAQPGPPYVDGRFSNGPVWADIVAQDFVDAGRPNGNFAYGGAWAVTNADPVPDFDLQLGLFAARALGETGSRPLASVLFGGNDIIAGVRAGTGIDSALAAANRIGQNVMVLAGLGVRDVALWTLPDLGAAPIFGLFQPGLASAATEASEAFNTRLGEIIRDLRGAGLGVARVDLAAVFRDVLADPGAYGLTETALPCIFPSPEAASFFGQPQVCTGAQSMERLFFDSLHPNLVGHQAIAGQFLAALAPVPLPASVWVLLAALGGLGVAARRRPSLW